MGRYSAKEQQIILSVADQSIRSGLAHHHSLKINLNDYPSSLIKLGASFVTLEIAKKLRGCIGTLEAYQPLIKDIAENAFLAAFRDPRFMPVTQDEYSKLTKHISILSAPESIHFFSEEDLLTKLQPGIDGLIISDHGNRGTFLPAVWDELPDPKLFLQHLKLKAGFPIDYWSDSLQIYRYSVEVIE